MKTFGEKLKELRNEVGLTQPELAEKLFLDKSTIAKYETDKIKPSPEVIVKIAKFFDVSTDYLFGLKDF